MQISISRQGRLPLASLDEQPIRLTAARPHFTQLLEIILSHSRIISVLTLTTLLAMPSMASARLIDQVVQPETIGMNLAYLEKLAGPAERTYFNGNRFTIDNCNLTVTADPNSKSITAVEIEASPSCQVDLRKVLQLNTPVTLSRLSFGQFESLLSPATYFADCLMSCGNAYDPNVYLHHEGPRATNFMEFRIGAPIAEDATIDAANRWQTAMSARESESWIMDGLFNCEPGRYHTVASQAFRNTRVQTFSFGHRLVDSLTAPCTSNPDGPPAYSLTNALDDHYAIERQNEAKAILAKVRTDPASFLDDCKKAEVPFAMELGSLSFDEAVERAHEVCGSMLQQYAACATRDQAVACVSEAMGEGD